MAKAPKIKEASRAKANTPKKARKGDAPNLSTEERRMRAFELRCYGLSLRSIAEQLNSTHVTIRKDIQIALQQAREENKQKIEDILLIESNKLDRITAEMMRQLIETKPTTHPVTCPQCKHSHRVVIREPLSPRERQGAAGILLQTADRRARMFGLDQPQKTQISVGDVSGIFESLADVIVDFVPEDKREALAKAIEERLSNLA